MIRFEYEFVFCGVAFEAQRRQIAPPDSLGEPQLRTFEERHFFHRIERDIPGFEGGAADLQVIPVNDLNGRRRQEYNRCRQRFFRTRQNLSRKMRKIYIRLK